MAIGLKKITVACRKTFKFISHRLHVCSFIEATSNILIYFMIILKIHEINEVIFDMNIKFMTH